MHFFLGVESTWKNGDLFILVTIHYSSLEAHEHGWLLLSLSLHPCLHPLFLYRGSRHDEIIDYLTSYMNQSTMPWIQYLVGELGASLHHTPILYCDNIGSTRLTLNPIFHARMKHIVIDYHFVQDRVAVKALDIRFLSSKYISLPLCVSTASILKIQPQRLFTFVPQPRI